MTLDELKSKLIGHGGCENAMLFENPDYADACIGFDTSSGRVIYSYSKMIKSLVDTENMKYDEAIDFIDYNTIRALPYGGEHAPIVMYDLEDL